MTTTTLHYYTGAIFEGRRHGWGALVLPSGVVQKGYWKQNLQHGFGTKLSQDGSFYAGDWFAGDRVGYGTFVGKNGSFSWTYEGQWLHNRCEGWGVLAFDNYRYEGFFKNDMKHGRGTLYISADPERVYVGDFRNNQYHGQGCLTYLADGERYQGGFEFDRKHGPGTYTFASGDTYVGTWDANRGLLGPGEYRFGDRKVKGVWLAPSSTGSDFVPSFEENFFVARYLGPTHTKIVCADGSSWIGSAYGDSHPLGACVFADVETCSTHNYLSWMDFLKVSFVKHRQTQ